MDYYNDNDKYAAQWLRNLIDAGVLPPGDVDDRSIKEVTADDLRPYRRVHLFAGIGGWAYALDLAGWPRDRVVWTGSCPCQPFSVAGRGGGTSDERHLWPDFARLLRECSPPVVFGEQVASGLGRKWLAGVRADLERGGYGVGAVDLPAASVSSPQIRQRLWWSGWMVDADHLRHSSPTTDGACDGREDSEGSGVRSRGMAYPSSGGWRQEQPHFVRSASRVSESGSCDDPWGDHYVVRCELDPRTGEYKHRRVGSGVQPLAHGVSGRVGRLRAYGNAIVPQVAAVFVRAALEAARDAGLG